jgi:hypothetical protein
VRFQEAVNSGGRNGGRSGRYEKLMTRFFNNNNNNNTHTGRRESEIIKSLLLCFTEFLAIHKCFSLAEPKGMILLSSFLVTTSLVVASAAGLRGRSRNVKHPEEFVNILGGTDSRYDMSHGNTLPLTARPWGFNSWAPYTGRSSLLF